MFWLNHIPVTWMDSFDTYTVVRYWSKILQSTIPTLLSDHDVKVMDLENWGVLDWMFW